MKNNKLIKLIPMALLLSLLGGCAELSDKEIDVSQLSKEVGIAETSQNKQNERKTHEAEETKGEGHQGRRYSVIIEKAEEISYKRAVVFEMNKAQLMTDKEHKLYDDYKGVRISEIEEFYSLDNFKIGGFELYSTAIMGGVFIYHYAPINPPVEKLDIDGNYRFCYTSGIQLQITRKDIYEHYNEKPPTTIKQVVKRFANIEDVEVEGELFFGKATSFNRVGGLIGETWFDMHTPKSIDLDSALQIGRDLIDSAELVNVQYELDVLRQQSE
jgi:hypothetical protein